MRILAVMFASPLYFAIRGRWGAFVFNLFLYFLALVTLIGGFARGSLGAISCRSTWRSEGLGASIGRGVSRLLVGALALSVVGCGGSPSAPASNQPSSGGGWTATGALSLGSAIGVANILEVEVRIDGTVVGRTAQSGQAGLSVGIAVNAARVGSGQHTLTIVIVRQANSPHSYNSTGAINFVRDNTFETRSVNCQRQQVLATGDAISCSFTLP